MHAFLRTLNRRLTSPRFDIGLVRAFCFIGGPLVLVMASYKMASLRMTESELLLGVLSTMACTLLIVIVGLVAPLTMRVKDANKNGAQ